MLKRLPFYPFLLAIWPPLALAAKNPTEISAYSELVVPMLFGVIVAILVLAFAVGIGRSIAWSGMGASVMVLGTWWFRELANLVAQSPAIHAIGLNRQAPAIAAFSIIGLGFLISRRSGAWAESATRPLNLMAAILVLFPLASLARSGIAPSLASLAGPAPVVGELDGEHSLPDVYLILLDSYAGVESLRQVHGFDNTLFIDALRDRGFTVPQHAVANYTWTTLAVASALNWGYIHEDRRILESWPPPGLDALAPSIIGNRTLRELSMSGYHFAFVPSSTWFFRTHPWADTLLGPERRFVSGFQAHWPRSTPLPELRRVTCRFRQCPVRTPWQPETAFDFDQKFEAIASFAQAPRLTPRLTFAHFMLPHEPFVYAKDCKPRAQIEWPAITGTTHTPEIVEAYVTQLQCLNERLVVMIDAILRSSSIPPIIVLQSDHGQRYQLDEYPASSARVNEWLDIFAAYLVPQEIAAHLYDGISPISAFHTIIGALTGNAEAPPGDSSFLSVSQDIFKLEKWSGSLNGGPRLEPSLGDH
jgi:hypothetical protein